MRFQEIVLGLQVAGLPSESRARAVTSAVQENFGADLCTIHQNQPRVVRCTPHKEKDCLLSLKAENWQSLAACHRSTPSMLSKYHQTKRTDGAQTIVRQAGKSYLASRITGTQQPLWKNLILCMVSRLPVCLFCLYYYLYLACKIPDTENFVLLLI